MPISGSSSLWPGIRVIKAVVVVTKARIKVALPVKSMSLALAQAMSVRSAWAASLMVSSPSKVSSRISSKTREETAAVAARMDPASAPGPMPTATDWLEGWFYYSSIVWSV